jgi:hypothetical protein
MLNDKRKVDEKRYFELDTTRTDSDSRPDDNGGKASLITKTKRCCPSTKTQASFQLFPELPPEIRLKIWSYATGDPLPSSCITTIPDPDHSAFSNFTSLYEDEECDDRKFCYNSIHRFLILGKGEGLPKWLGVNRETRGYCVRGMLMGKAGEGRGRWPRDEVLSLPVGKKEVGDEEGLVGRCLHIVREGAKLG